MQLHLQQLLERRGVHCRQNIRRIARHLGHPLGVSWFLLIGGLTHSIRDESLFGPPLLQQSHFWVVPVWLLL